MMYGNAELHNVAEAVPVEPGGVRLQRVPEHVRAELNEGAQMRMLQPDNAEIRFVCPGPVARVTLSSPGQSGMTVFQGTFDSRQRHVLGPDHLDHDPIEVELGSARGHVFMITFDFETSLVQEIDSMALLVAVGQRQKNQGPLRDRILHLCFGANAEQLLDISLSNLSTGERRQNSAQVFPFQAIPIGDEKSPGGKNPG